MLELYTPFLMIRKLILITATFVLFFSILIVPATSTPAIHVNAPDDVKSDFSVVIEIENVEDLDSGQFDLHFNRTAVSVSSIDDGSIDGTTIPVADWEVGEDKVTVLFNLPGIDGISGSGTLATIHFHTIVPGECTMQIKKGLLVNTLAGRISGIWDGIEDPSVEETEDITTTKTDTNAEEGPGFGMLLSICVLAVIAIALKKNE